MATPMFGTIAQLADYLVNGYWSSRGTIAHRWASHTITYNLGDLNAQEQTDALAALTLWSSVANVTFVQTNASPNISFNHDGTGAATSAAWDNNGYMTSATVSISSNWYPGGVGSYMFQTYIHEIGHALGLGHQGPYNISATYGVDNIFTNDTWQWSIMSYFAQNNYGGASFDYVVTPEWPISMPSSPFMEQRVLGQEIQYMDLTAMRDQSTIFLKVPLRGHLLFTIAAATTHWIARAILQTR